MQFGHGESVADKDGGGFDIFCSVRVDVESRVVAQFYGFCFSVAEQLQRAARLINAYDIKVHGLAVAIDAGRLQSCGAKLCGHVISGFLETGAASVPAFEGVVGEKLHVRPPALAESIPIRGLRAREGARKNQQQGSEHALTAFHV